MTTEEITQELEETTAEAAAPVEESTEAELEKLRAEVQRLTEELEKKLSESERVASQISELYELFPDTDVSRIPDEVWESVREGNSLAAAYALHARKQQQREQNARKVLTNRRKSAIM